VTIEAGGEARQPNGAVLRARGPGIFGSGGRLDVAAGTRIVLRDVDLSSPGAGGVVDASAPQSLDVRGVLDASATGSSGVGGTITLQSCTVNVARTGALDTRGPVALDGFATNTLRASGALTVAGTARAGTLNRFVHKGVLPVVTGTVAPAAVVVLDAALPDCPRTPTCGDGFVDDGEACDDGNSESCDGCSASCTRADAACGDGVPECGEGCDDGNRAEGDGCEADCTRTPPSGVRVRGVPLVESGCLAQWALALPAPALDPDTGVPSQRQSCRDGDPGCDADETVDGVCTIAARVCVKVPDPVLPACAPQSVKLLSLDRPKSTGATDAVDRGNGDALRAGLGALGVKLRSGGTLLRTGTPVTADDTCTEPMLLRVPHEPGAPGERTFRISARAHGAPQMRRNGLTIVCETAAATCGDGVRQSGEECDDGNGASCDGCSAACTQEACGNGVLECSEECDEGAANGRGDGACSATCERRTPELRIPGGGARRADCTFEWSALGSAEAFARDRHGLPRGTFVCADGDPTCDLDPRPGTCRVRIWGCFGGPDERLGCTARAADGVTVRGPAASVRRAPEVAARAALIAAFAGVAFPSGPGERCTAPIELDVPVRQAWLDLKVEVPLADAPAADRDALRIRCR
jgi:cysteine-rich repeat protein